MALTAPSSRSNPRHAPSTRDACDMKKWPKHTNDYNKIMTSEIERCYGAGILNRLADEASEMYAATHNQSP